MHDLGTQAVLRCPVVAGKQTACRPCPEASLRGFCKCSDDLLCCRACKTGPGFFADEASPICESHDDSTRVQLCNQVCPSRVSIGWQPRPTPKNAGAGVRGREWDVQVWRSAANVCPVRMTRKRKLPAALSDYVTSSVKNQSRHSAGKVKLCDPLPKLTLNGHKGVGPAIDAFDFPRSARPDRPSSEADAKIATGVSTQAEHLTQVVWRSTSRQRMAPQRFRTEEANTEPSEGSFRFDVPLQVLQNQAETLEEPS